MWPRCGPGGQEFGGLSATHGLPSLGERWLRWLVAPRKGLDPETNRGEGAEDQQENDDPAHRWFLPPSPASLEQPAPQYKGALVVALAPPVVRVRPVPRWPSCRCRREDGRRRRPPAGPALTPRSRCGSRPAPIPRKSRPGPGMLGELSPWTATATCTPRPTRRSATAWTRSTAPLSRRRQAQSFACLGDPGVVPAWPHGIPGMTRAPPMCSDDALTCADVWWARQGLNL
jgi:hypothetical protein